jgi:hypothetical protein
METERVGDSDQVPGQSPAIVAGNNEVAWLPTASTIVKKGRLAAKHRSELAKSIIESEAEVKGH